MIDDVSIEHRPTLAQARHLLGCFRRYFAGRPRAASDRLHLIEIIDRLELLERRCDDAPALRDGLGVRLALLRDELAACDAELRREAPAAERAGNLAARANQQFTLYHRHFANRTRLTRRTELAERVFLNLKKIRREMKRVPLGELPDGDAHRRNLDLVDTQLAQLESEGNHIVTERRHAAIEELVRQLGADATAEIGAHRRDPDLDARAGICDRLGELVYQMDAIALEHDDPINRANLRRASTQLAAFEAALAELMP